MHEISALIQFLGKSQNQKIISLMCEIIAWDELKMFF